MAVQQHGLHFGEHVVVAIQIAPARLHHADLFFGEEVNRALQKVDRRQEVRVKDRHDLAGRSFQAVLQSSGFESMPVGSMNILNREASFCIFGA